MWRRGEARSVVCACAGLSMCLWLSSFYLNRYYFVSTSFLKFRRSARECRGSPTISRLLRHIKRKEDNITSPARAAGLFL